MRRIIATILVAGAFIAPAAIGTAPAAAVTSYPCNGSPQTDGNCTRVDRYYCDGYIFDAYRFWGRTYNFQTGGYQASKETYVVQRKLNGQQVYAFYMTGWGSPC